MSECRNVGFPSTVGPTYPAVEVQGSPVVSLPQRVLRGLTLCNPAHSPLWESAYPVGPEKMHVRSVRTFC